MKKKKWLKWLGICGLLLVIGCLVYVQDYYHATDKEEALLSTADVNVMEVEEGYFYDGPGTEGICVFYPGAKVEDLSYGTFLKKIAAEGMDCLLVHMPCNLAFLGKDKAEQIREAYEYETYYLAGHSLGGAMAASYLAKHQDEWDGLILFAAYSVDDLSKSDLKVLSLYGSEDQVLNRDKLIEGQKLMPKAYKEYCIQGGNHGQFGEYGQQKGDGDATISSQEQKQIAVEKIIEFSKGE